MLPPKFAPSSVNLTKRWVRPLVLASLILLVTTAVTQAQCGLPDDGQIHVPTNYTTFTPPAKGSSYIDPVFGCTITRLTDATATGIGEHHQQTYHEPFNADDSLILLVNENGQWYVIAGPNDGATPLTTVVVPIANMPAENNNGPLWDLSNSNVFYYANGNSFYKGTINRSAGTVTPTLIKTFSEYTYVCMSGETFGMDLSNDGDHIALLGQSGGSYCGGASGQDIFVFTISSASKGTPHAVGLAQPHGHQISPDGKAVWDGPSGKVAWDGTTLYTIDPPSSHADWGYKNSSTLVYVMQREASSGQTDPCTHHMGASYSQAPYSYPNLNIACLYDQWQSLGADSHVSFRNEVGGSPWVIVSMFDDGRNPGPEWYETNTKWAGSNWANYWGTLGTSSTTYEGEIDAVNINTGKVLRLAHHRSRTSENYWATSRATPSHDGKYILFDSNMAVAHTGTSIINYGDVYMIAFQTGGTTPLPPTNLGASVQ